MKITQIQEDDHTFRVQAWWQNEHIINTYLSSRNYDSELGLYVAGDHPKVINGQVRNFSYVKK